MWNKKENKKITTRGRSLRHGLGLSVIVPANSARNGWRDKKNWSIDGRDRSSAARVRSVKAAISRSPRLDHSHNWTSRILFNSYIANLHSFYLAVRGNITLEAHQCDSECVNYSRILPLETPRRDQARN